MEGRVSKVGITPYVLKDYIKYELIITHILCDYI